MHQGLAPTECPTYPTSREKLWHDQEMPGIRAGRRLKLLFVPCSPHLDRHAGCRSGAPGMQSGCQNTSVPQAQGGCMLVGDAAGPPHSCGSKAPMEPKMSRNSSLTHTQGQGTGPELQREQDMEPAEPAPDSLLPAPGSFSFLPQALLSAPGSPSCPRLPHPA